MHDKQIQSSFKEDKHYIKQKEILSNPMFYFTDQRIHPIIVSHALLLGMEGLNEMCSDLAGSLTC